MRYEFEPPDQRDLTKVTACLEGSCSYIDRKLVGDADSPYTTPFVFNPGPADLRCQPRLADHPDYDAPFRFTGRCTRSRSTSAGKLIKNDEVDLRMDLARQ